MNHLKVRPSYLGRRTANFARASSLAVFMKLSLMNGCIHSIEVGKDGRYGFEISGKYERLAFAFRLLVRLIWFSETAKLNKPVASNFKRMT